MPKPVPFDFVLDELAPIQPRVRPFFGGYAVYRGPVILFMLRDGKPDPDNGIWVATTREHHATLREEIPSLRTITVLNDGEETGWQLIPRDSDAFEEDVTTACRLIRARDPRIGKLPKPKSKKKKPVPKPAATPRPRSPRLKTPRSRSSRTRRS